jgi:hypothetical protein
VSNALAKPPAQKSIRPATTIFTAGPARATIISVLKA